MMMVAKKVLLQLLKSSGRCPLCGGISRTPYSTGRMSGVRLVIPERRIAERIAKIMTENSENKSRLLEKGSVGGPYLSEALGGAGFKDILDTDQHQLGKNEDESLVDVVMESDSLFSKAYLNSFEASDYEVSLCKRLPEKSWTDDPVITVLGAAQPPQMKILHYLIDKLHFLSGLYKAGRVEWFLFLPAHLARRLLCGTGECEPEGFRCLTGVVLNAFYDVKLCTTLTLDDFTPRFKSVAVKKQVKISNTVITQTTVPLVQLVPRRDLFNVIQPDDIGTFYRFMKQILRSGFNRIIPQMETFVPGCGLKMIDMGFTMMNEVRDITPQQYLHLYVSLLSWPEYQGSALQFELTGHPTATTEDLEGPSIMEEDSHTDSLDSTNNVINISASIRNS